MAVWQRPGQHDQTVSRGRNSRGINRGRGVGDTPGCPPSASGRRLCSPLLSWSLKWSALLRHDCFPIPTILKGADLI